MLNILISFITLALSKSIEILTINETSTSNHSNNYFKIANNSNFQELNKLKATVFYLSPPEGISSRYKQLEDLWRFTAAVNKSIVLPFTLTNAHYGEKVINMCELFQLPSNIICSNWTYQAITNSTSCVLTEGINEVPPEYYTLRNTTLRQRYVDLHKTRCIAGYVDHTLSTNSLKTGFPKHEMHQQYLSLLPILQETLGVSQPKLNYAVFHWRRGDQLISRCIIPPSKNVAVDNSVNCDTVWDFIELVQTNLKEYCTKQTIVYVATNEANNASLNALKRHGYKLFMDIVPSISSMIEVNALSSYAVELAMMCDAAYFFAWGKSTAHPFIEHCRDATKKKHIKLTFTNEVVFRRPK
mmetsp:Transcript_31376/g.45128  ORF Transcript_31376/g.45128 Transcript_31376/m.45128 type:complete len:356 (-) Transcript_31376:150-1217(-)